MTLAELEYWSVRHRWGQGRRDEMEDYLRGVEVYLPDQDLYRNWAEVTRRAERKGRPITCADAWIAATAYTLGVPLVTHNASDFAAVDGVRVVTAK